MKTVHNKIKIKTFSTVATKISIIRIITALSATKTTATPRKSHTSLTTAFITPMLPTTVFEGSSKFLAASCKNESNLLLVWIMVCMSSNCDLFRRTMLQKCGRDIYVLFLGLRLVSKEFQHPTIKTKIEQHLGGFFHQIKVHQPLGRQDSMQTVIQQAGGQIHFCMKQLRT
jgi:hypothetical protein